MKPILIILAVLLLYSCHNNIGTAQKQAKNIPDTADKIILPSEDHKIEYRPYDFDTILSGGYYLKYKLDTTNLIQSLTLMKGNQEIRLLNDCSYPLLSKNLGYIGTDFDSSFVFVQSFGSGNPHYIQLIDKETGKILLKGLWMDADEKEQILLYYVDESDNNKKIFLYDVRKNKKMNITNDYTNINCQWEGGLRYCIEIDTVTAKQIVVKVKTKKGVIIRKYSR